MARFINKQLLLFSIVGLSLALPANAMEMLDIEDLNYSSLQSHFHHCIKTPKKREWNVSVGDGPVTVSWKKTPASKCQQSGKEPFCIDHVPTAQLESTKVAAHLIKVRNEKNWARTILQTTPLEDLKIEELNKASILSSFHNSCASIPNGCQKGLYYWCLNNNPDAAPWFRLESAHLILVRNEINAIETGIQRVRLLP